MTSTVSKKITTDGILFILTPSQFQKKHRWFLGRRKITEHWLQKLNLPPDAKILEVGCGTGGNLSLLFHYGQVYAMELNEFARDFAKHQHNRIEVQLGFLPNNISLRKEPTSYLCHLLG